MDAPFSKGAAKPHGIATAPPLADTLAHCFVTSYAGVIAFLAVAHEGSFSRAGDRLGIGRSAVSRNVQKLEAQLEARLFHRTTRKTTLTREGQLFYENCQPGVDRIIHALEDMRDLRNGPPHGHLRIQATPGFGRKVISPLLHSFQAAYPNITLELLLDYRPADLTAERIDVSFCDGSIAQSDIVARHLMPMQLVVCASRAYADNYGLPTSITELARHRCINFRSDTGRIRDWEFAVNGGIQKRRFFAQHTFNDLDLVLDAVIHGQGIAQLPAYMVCDDIKRERLVIALEHHISERGGHYICYLSRKQLPARIRAFVDYTIEYMHTVDFTLQVQC